jgi:hypothetical protein
MPVKITLRGPRLGGNYVCLLDGPSSHLTINQRDSGNIDVCNRLIWPDPRDCRLLVPDDPIIGEFPFSVFGGLRLEYYEAIDPVKYRSRDAAWTAAMAAGVREEWYPNADAFWITLLAGAWGGDDGYWTAASWRNLQNMRFDPAVLNPGWQHAEDIQFYIVFTPPRIAGVPDLFRLHSAGSSWAFNSPEVHIPVDHDTMYGISRWMEFVAAPVKFSLVDLDQLPEIYTDFRGFDYRDFNEFNLRVVVRRGIPEYTVEWPDDVAEGAKFAIVRHRGTGQIMGPAIPLGDVPDGGG